jgi:hypothetical protein
MSIERTVIVEDDASRRTLTAWCRRVGTDHVIVVGGGEAPHVGCVVLAVPYASKAVAGGWSASCSVLTIPPHKEEPIARGVALRLAEASGQNVVVTAGVHDDDLDRAGIECYLRLGDRLASEVVASVLDPRDGAD